MLAIREIEVHDHEKNLYVQEDYIQEGDIQGDFIRKSIENIQIETLEKIIQALFREQILDYRQEKDRIIFFLPRTNKQLIVEKANFNTLNRHLGFKKISLISPDRIGNLDDPKYLIDLLSAEMANEESQEQWKKLALEIENHIHNALYSSQNSLLLGRKINKESKILNVSSFMDWLKLNLTIKNKQVYIEQWTSKGHPSHPCGKTKLGFSLQDLIKYAPEFHPSVKLMIVAVRNDYIHIESMFGAQEYLSWFAEAYPDTWREFVYSMKQKNLLLSDYTPLPVHPWQLEHHIYKIFKPYIDEKIIFLFERVQINATPTLSFRTLAPMQDEFAPHIKLPIAVQATSVFRTLAPSSTVNTPRISSIMKQILVQENNFDNSIHLIHEPYGLHIKNIEPDEAKHLTVIFRENPNLYLSKEENAIVISALFENSPITGLPLFIELMHQAHFMSLDQAIEYFAYYCNKVLSSYLDLYLLYGIALEGHQQNTLAVFKEGKIMRFIARDLDGTDLHAGTLQHQGITFNAHPNSCNLVESKDQVRKSLLHAVYQCHLGELVILLLKYFDCEAELFWNVVKNITEERFLKLKPRISLVEWEEEYRQILIEKWPCKALLRMRVLKEYRAEGLFLEINNPLKPLS